MSGRDSRDEEHTAVRRNGDDRRDHTPADLSDMTDRWLLERIFQQGVENSERITVTYHAFEAHRVDEARRWKAQRETNDVMERAVLELVASDRAHRDTETKLRTEQGIMRAEARTSIASVRKDLERQIAEAKRVSLVDEEERKVIVGLASVGVEAARDHVGARTAERAKQNELVVADAADALQARKERRALAVAGVRRVATIVIPILTGLAIAATALLQKGC